ncbi:hypothetical protein ACFL08_01005 [Patescibacteria group bacterium]
MAGLLEALTFMVIIVGVLMITRYKFKKNDTSFVKKLCYYSGVAMAISVSNMFIYGYWKVELESWFLYLNYAVFVTIFISFIFFIVKINLEKRFFRSTMVGFAIYFGSGVFSTITMEIISKGVLL